MGEIKKIEDEYYVEFVARGLTYQQRGGKSKKEAQKLLKDIEAKIAQGELGTLDHDVDVDIFLKTFLEYAKKEHSAQTYLRFIQCIKYFEEFLNKETDSVVKLSDLTPRIIEQFICFLKDHADFKERDSNTTAINLQIYLMREILQHGITLGNINDNPTLHVVFLKGRQGKRPETLNEEELKSLTQGARDNLKRIMRLIYHTGLRLEELVVLEPKDINFEKRCIMVVSFKGNKQLESLREIPIDAQAEKILKDGVLKFGEHEDGLKRALDEFLNERGEKLTFNCFRHSFARRHLEKGISLIRLQKLMGVEDIAQMMIYADFSLNINPNR